MRVLIAEDEGDFRKTLAKALRAEGYAVDEAEDGNGALYKIEGAAYDAGADDYLPKPASAP